MNASDDQIDGDDIHFEYSDAQWHAVCNALEIHAVSPEALTSIRRKLAWEINVFIIDDDSFREFFVEERREAETIIKAIDLLEGAIGYRVGLVDELAEGGRSSRDVVGRVYDRARPSLNTLRRIAANDLERLERLNSSKPAKSNNERKFAKRLISTVASIWEKCGGQINHSAEYRAFFEATVRPVMLDRGMQQKHGAAWSDGIFRNHVQQLMKSRDIKGARGPKRRNSV